MSGKGEKKMEKVKIIAEAGVNHNGSIPIAKRLIEEAKWAGADAVKFQTYTLSELVVKKADKADYQKKNTKEEETQYDMLKKFLLSKEEWLELLDYCRQKEITFLSSPFDLKSIDFLQELGVELFKVPSGQITDYCYLKKLAQLHKPIILSTGMATIEEISEALHVLKGSRKTEDDTKKEPKPDITLLHCTSDYPAKMEEVNLKAMLQLQTVFQKPVGYSDHTEGVEVAIAAVSLGAAVIEKHFTLDRNLPGPDHKGSLLPAELRQLVKSVRNIEKALGDGIKRPTDSEQKNKRSVRKSLVAIRPIKKGEVYTVHNIGAKRPGDGISPMRYKEMIGTKANRNYEPDERIEL